MTGLSGCGGAKKAIKALSDKHRPAIERNLAALPAIAEQIRSLPPLSEDGLEGAHILIADLFASRDKAPSAAVCYAEDLENSDELGYVWGRLEGTGALNHCASLLHRGHAAYDPAHPEHPLKGISLAETRWRYPRCADYRYLLVIRTREFVAPSPATQATDLFAPLLEVPEAPALPAPKPRAHARHRVWRRLVANAPDVEPDPAIRMLLPEEKAGHRQVTRYRFEGGFLRAELLVFSLPSAKPLGGFRFTAESHLEIQGKDGEIRADFERAIGNAVYDVLEKSEATGKRKAGKN